MTTQMSVNSTQASRKAPRRRAAKLHLAGANREAQTFARSAGRKVSGSAPTPPTSNEIQVDPASP